MKLRLTLLLVTPLLVVLSPLRAWDYDGHRMVNQVALASLPVDFPSFVQESANAERIAFLAGEPDRWRNVPTDLPLTQINGVDHYLDLEELADAGLDPATVPSLRYDFAAQFAAGRAAHLERFAPVDPAKNADHSREWCGFAPWAITEQYGKLKSAFSYLKAYQEAGTLAEVANAQANIVYIMGVMGHYVGDCSQPLHATVHHHGWAGDNPHGYSRWQGIHGWVDGGLIAKAGIKFAALAPRITPAQPLALSAQHDGRDPMFVSVMDYLLETQKLVVPLYELEKAGKLSHSKEEPVVPEGRDFIETQLVRGGEKLGAIWLTAWRSAPPDTYLRAQLLKRQTVSAPPKTIVEPASEKMGKGKKLP